MESAQIAGVAAVLGLALLLGWLAQGGRSWISRPGWRARRPGGRGAWIELVDEAPLGSGGRLQLFRVGQAAVLVAAQAGHCRVLRSYRWQAVAPREEPQANPPVGRLS